MVEALLPHLDPEGVQTVQLPMGMRRSDDGLGVLYRSSDPPLLEPPLEDPIDETEPETEPDQPLPPRFSKPTTIKDAGFKPPQKSHTALIIGLVSLGAIVALAGALLLGYGIARRGVDRARPVQGAVTTAAPQSPPPPPPTIQLSVRTIPDGARLTLDGAFISATPFTGRFPHDGIAHRIDASAEGYQPTALYLVFDQDRDVELRLEPLPSAGDSSSNPIPQSAEPAVTPSEHPGAPSKSKSLARRPWDGQIIENLAP
jgi:hypothetical protein